MGVRWSVIEGELCGGEFFGENPDGLERFDAEGDGASRHSAGVFAQQVGDGVGGDGLHDPIPPAPLCVDQADLCEFLITSAHGVKINVQRSGEVSRGGEGFAGLDRATDDGCAKVPHELNIQRFCLGWV